MGKTSAPQNLSVAGGNEGAFTHHDKVDEGYGVGIDSKEVHATKHVQDYHTDHQHEDGSCPNVEPKHQNRHKEHST